MSARSMNPLCPHNRRGWRLPRALGSIGAATLLVALGGCSGGSEEPEKASSSTASTPTTDPVVRPKVQPVPTVRLEGTLFVPKELSVVAGTEVLFVNVDGGEHTVVADDGTTFATIAGSEFAAKGARRKVKFDQPGDYGIHCGVHGGPGTGMSGIIHVTA